MSTPIFNVTFSGITKLLCRIDCGLFVIHPFEVTATSDTVATFLSSVATINHAGVLCRRLTIAEGVTLIYEFDSCGPHPAVIKIYATKWTLFLDQIKMRSLLNRMAAHLVGLQKADSVGTEAQHDCSDDDAEPDDEDRQFLDNVDDIFEDLHQRIPTSFVYCRPHDPHSAHNRAQTAGADHFVYYSKKGMEDFFATGSLQIYYVGSKYEILKDLLKTRAEALGIGLSVGDIKGGVFLLGPVPLSIVKVTK